MDWTIAIAAGSLEAVILTSAIGVVWKLTRTEVDLRGEFNKRIAEIHAAAAEMRGEFNKQIAEIHAASAEKVAEIRAEHTREIAALTAKVYQIEIWARDEFVRKGSFELVVARLEKSMDLLAAKVEGSVDKMATRIENMSHHKD